MEIVPELLVNTATTKTICKQSIVLLITVPEKGIDTKTLVDSGADGIFIHPRIVQKYKIPEQKLKRPIKVRNIDGTLNKTGSITTTVDLTFHINGRIQNYTMHVTEIGKWDFILGLPWL